VKIDRLILGAFETNCYILRESESAKDCLIVDPGLDAGELIDFLAGHKLNPVAVILTHGHIDHMAGVVLLRENCPEIKVHIHKLDAQRLFLAAMRCLPILLVEQTFRAAVWHS